MGLVEFKSLVKSWVSLLRKSTLKYLHGAQPENIPGYPELILQGPTPRNQKLKYIKAKVPQYA